MTVIGCLGNLLLVIILCRHQLGSKFEIKFLFSSFDWAWGRIANAYRLRLFLASTRDRILALLYSKGTLKEEDKYSLNSDVLLDMMRCFITAILLFRWSNTSDFDPPGSSRLHDDCHQLPLSFGSNQQHLQARSMTTYSAECTIIEHAPHIRKWKSLRPEFESFWNMFSLF